MLMAASYRSRPDNPLHPLGLVNPISLDFEKEDSPFLRDIPPVPFSGTNLPCSLIHFSQMNPERQTGCSDTADRDLALPQNNRLKIFHTSTF